MNEEVKKVGIPSIPDEDAEKLADEDLIASDKPISKAVFKKRLNKVIGQREAEKDKVAKLTTREKELLEDVKELGEYKGLRELTNSDPRLAKIIMEALEEAYGEQANVVAKKKVPAKVRKTGKSESDKRMDRMEQKQDDAEIEKHFDAIGVKKEQIKELTEFCKKRGYSMTDKTLLEMAYNKVFPEVEEEEEDDKAKEPDSGSRSGMDYGDKPVKTVRDAINFALEYHKKKKK